MALLEVENLSKAFGGLMAVNRVSFVLNQGEIVGLVGPNGSGKTTLFNLITGILRPDAGRIKFNDKDITGIPAYKICQSGIARDLSVG